LLKLTAPNKHKLTSHYLCHRKKAPGVNKASREREKGFSLSAADADVPHYDSLYDQDLRHYFDNRFATHHLSLTEWVESLG